MLRDGSNVGKEKYKEEERCACGTLYGEISKRKQPSLCTTVPFLGCFNVVCPVYDHISIIFEDSIQRTFNLW